jgi:hypothetical protein
MQWTYIVKGIPPVYKPPEAKGGRLDNKRRSMANLGTDRTRQSKNFIKNNIRGARSLSPENSIVIAEEDQD